MLTIVPLSIKMGAGPLVLQGVSRLSCWIDLMATWLRRTDRLYLSGGARSMGYLCVVYLPRWWCSLRRPLLCIERFVVTVRLLKWSRTLLYEVT